MFHSQCNVLGNNLKDLVDKCQHYEDASSGLLSGLQACEATASRHLSEPIAVDPTNLQRQLEEMKVRETRGRERSSPGIVPQETLLSPHFCDPARRARGEGLGRCACPSSGLLTWSSHVCPFLFLLLWFSWSHTAVVVYIPPAPAQTQTSPARTSCGLYSYLFCSSSFSFVSSEVRRTDPWSVLFTAACRGPHGSLVSVHEWTGYRGLSPSHSTWVPVELPPDSQRCTVQLSPRPLLREATCPFECAGLLGDNVIVGSQPHPQRPRESSPFRTFQVYFQIFM